MKNIHILILLIILVILICLLITLTCNAQPHNIYGGKNKKYFIDKKFLFPIFGTHSRNKILYIDSKQFLENKKILINLHKNDIRSIILQTYKYPNQVAIINYLLDKLIYPIDFRIAANDLKMYKINDKKANLFTTYNLPKKNITNWQLPLGIYMHKVLEENECDILTKYLIAFFKKISPNKMKLKHFISIDILANLLSGKEHTIKGLLNWIKQNKKLYINMKNMIDKFLKIFYGNNYTTNYNVDDFYQQFVIVIGYYAGHSDGLNCGKRLHTDHFDKAATSVISLENSILDFVPWAEIFEKKHSFRVIIPKGYILTFDGDVRHYYTHGVPSNIKYPNNVRFSFNIRHPLLDSKKNINCTGQFNNIPELKKINCISSSFDNPIQFDYI